jgi:nitrate reductase cytochrome c-type subunit
VKRLKQVVVLTFVVVALVLFVNEVLLETGQAQQQNPPAATPTQPEQSGAASGPRDYKATYDHFDDQKVNRQAVESHKVLTDANRCDSCHGSINVFVSRALEPRPYHDTCVVCHAEQFTSPKLEICVSCHPTPIVSDKEGVTKYYQFSKDLKQFGMEFSHNTHSRRANWNCATCHETPNDGKTARSTFPDHPECYECHKETNTPAKGGCIECHNKGANAEKFYSKNRSQIAMAYDYFKFNHGIHLVQPSIGNKCDDCHDVTNSDSTNNPDISRIKLVLSSNPAVIHKSLCFKCHDPNPSQSLSTCGKCHSRAPGSLALSPPAGYKKP